MKYKLFDYQETGVAAIEDFFSHGGESMIFQQPTGTGKTLVGSTFIERALDQSKLVYFVTSSGALLWQFSKHLEDLGIRHGIVKAGCPTLRYRVQVVSVQSLVSRAHMLDAPEYVIFEEAHHAAASQFLKVREIWPHVKILGLTATPQRTDGKPLALFEHLYTSPSVRWFIDNCYLSDFDYYVPVECDTSGIHRQCGDFKANELNERLQNDRARLGNMVSFYERYARGLPAIAFGTSIADSESIAAQFTEAGYGMTAIHSKIDGNVQDILDSAREGKISFVSSCDMVGEGVSVNGLTVEIDGRPTDSLVIKLQHSGRVLRAVYAPGYDLSTLDGRRAAMQAGGKGKAQILDFSSNYLRHGLPDDERKWSLSGSVKQSSASIYKRCPSCQRPVPTFAAVCPYCSYEFPSTVAAPSDGPEEVEGELVPISQLAVSDKSTLVVRIAREANDLKGAILVAKSMGANHQAAWYAWCVILKKPAKSSAWA